MHLLKKMMLVTLGSVIVLNMPAFASSDNAWAAHDRKVAQKCTAASGLMNATVSSKPIMFDDSVGYTAVIVRGHLKPMAGSASKATATQQKLCLYMRKTEQVHIAEISTATR